MAARKILVIDNDAASRNYISAGLRQEGYEVLLAPSAMEGLIAAWRDRPDLILVEPATADMGGEVLATRLRGDPRTRRTPLVALSSDASEARRQSCLKAGFSEYHVKSSRAMLVVIDSVQRQLMRAAAAADGCAIVFLSAKGGTGTSSLCANLAMSMAKDQPKARLAVADLVLPVGSIAAFVGYEGNRNLVTAAQLPAIETTPDRMHDYLAHMDDWGFDLLAGSPDPEHSNALNVARMEDLIGALRAAYDFVIFDLGRSLSRFILPIIQRADLVVMIVAAEACTVRLSKIVWDYLQRSGVRPSSLYAILNRAVGLEGFSKAEVEQQLGLPIQVALPHVGSNLSVANNLHQPYLFKFPGDSASIMLKDTSRQMMALAKNLHMPA